MLRRAVFQIVWLRDLSVGMMLLGVSILACTLWVSRVSAVSTDKTPEYYTSMPPVVPISAVIPCNAEDFKTVAMSLASIANQTVMPHEVIMVVNLPPKASSGRFFIDLKSPAYTSQGFSADWEAHPLQTLPGGEYDHPSFSSPIEALEYVTSVLPSAAESVARIHDFKLYFRAGEHWAGANRRFGTNQTREGTELVTFFDCDDYMHPQRLEFVYRAFMENPELEALIHAYYSIKLTQWSDHIERFLAPLEYPKEPFAHPYEKLWAALPLEKLTPNTTEPEQNTKRGYFWWYAKDMPELGPNGAHNLAHNGWLTIKRNVLDDIEYPDTRRGQDSLYNWRLLANRRFWNFMDLKLASYVRFK